MSFVLCLLADGWGSAAQDCNADFWAKVTMLTFVDKKGKIVQELGKIIMKKKKKNQNLISEAVT